MNKYLWAAYRTDTNINPFGRDFVGYAGWHEIGDNVNALAEAARRFPDVSVENLEVNIA